MIAELTIERDDADRLLTHMASEHGIPVSIAQRIPGPALAKLCRRTSRTGISHRPQRR